MINLSSNPHSLNALYLATSVRNFGLALVGIFIPVYIYQLTGNFFYLPAFYGLSSLVALFSLLFGSGLITRLGASRSVLLANVFQVFNLLLLILMPRFLPFLWLAAILEGLIIPTFWVTYHLIFIASGHDGNFGKEIAWMGIFVSIVSALAPLFGGLVISAFGFNVLYLLGMGVILLSSIPIFWVGDHLGFRPEKPREILSQALSRNWRPIFSGFLGIRFEVLIATIVWPLYLFAIARSFTSLGAVTSVFTVAGVLLMIPAGRLVDRLGSQRVMPAAALMLAPAWILTSLFPSVLALSAINAYRGLSSPFYGIGIESFFYVLAKADPFLSVLKREVSIHLSQFLGAALIALLWLFFPQNWLLLFFTAALACFLATTFVSAKLR